MRAIVITHSDHNEAAILAYKKYVHQCIGRLTRLVIA